MSDVNDIKIKLLNYYSCVIQITTTNTITELHTPTICLKENQQNKGPKFK